MLITSPVFINLEKAFSRFTSDTTWGQERLAGATHFTDKETEACLVLLRWTQIKMPDSDTEETGDVFPGSVAAPPLLTALVNDTHVPCPRLKFKAGV